MKLSIVVRRIALALFALSPLGLLPADCPKCDCHFPVSDPKCVECCFFEKGTVTSSSSTAVTLAPMPGDEKQPTKTFQIQKTTKINGQLQPGEPATVYYHTVDGQNIATRVDGLGFSHGSLVPANLPDPPDTCAEVAEKLRIRGFPPGPPLPHDAMRVFFGNSEGYSTQQRLIVWTIGRDEILVLQKNESGMFVSAKVRGPDGRLEAEVVDNEFFINPRNSFRIQGVGTSSLVVFNPEGQRILEIEFLNPRVVKILGTFFGPNGEEIRIGEDEQLFSSHGAKLSISHSCFGGASRGIFELLPTGVEVR